jgi:hypothetical protein
MRRLAALGAFLAVAACSLACDEGLSKIAGPTPDLEPTFSSIQQEIFEASDSSGRAACITCHNTTRLTFVAGLNLEHAVAYDQLVNVASRERADLMRVAPSNPDASYIVHKLEGRSGIIGRQMPFSGPPFLTGGQIQIIRRWIEIGAPRN